MYKAYIGSEILLDPSSDITLSEPCLELVDNSAGSFTFHIHPDHPLYDQLKPTSRIDFYKVRNGEEEWVWSGRPIRSELQFELNKEVTCEGVLAWLADSVQEPAEYHDVTVMGLLDIFLTKHNQQVEASKRIKLGAVTVTDSNNSLFRYTNYENTLEAIQDKLVDRLGGHLRLRKEEDGFYLDYLADYPRTSAQAIEFGENLMDLFKENTFEEIGTVLIPLGAALEDEEKDPNFPAALEQRVTIRSVNNGSDMLVNETGVEEFGKIVRVEKWDDVHVPSILKSKAEQYLNVIRYESKTVTATAVDLSLAGIDTDDFRFLDRILVHSTPHDIDLSFPLVEMKIYPLSPESNQYTLGGAARSYIKKSSQTLSEVKSLVEMKPSISYVRKVAIDNATKILNQWAGMGYAIHTENESFFMDHPDKDEAKNVLRINMGGIGFSSTGIEGPYTYAWTLDGTFNTQFINAGSITADQLAVDYKQTVQQQITLAEQNAKDDTEEKLKSYWTQLEVETQIKNTADRILLQAKEEAKAMVDGLATDVEGNVLTQLVNYYTKAEIDVQKDQITQSVVDYKQTVQQQITLAEQNAKDDTEEKLKSYWTQLEVETQIKNTADRILLQAKEEAKAMVDGLATDVEGNVLTQLVNYYTKAEIDVQKDQITQSVEHVEETMSDRFLGYYSKSEEGNVLTQLVNYYTKAEIDVQKDQITQSVEHVEETMSDRFLGYYSKSEVQQLLDEWSVTVADQTRAQTPNLLIGTHYWDTPTLATGTTKAEDTNLDLTKLSIAHTVQNADRQIFRFRQDAIRFLSGNWYALSMYVNGPSGGQIKLVLDTPKFEIVEASTRSGTVTHTDKTMTLTAAASGRIVVLFKLGYRGLGIGAWRWNPFSFQYGVIPAGDVTTSLTGYIKAGSPAGTYTFYGVQLERGMEATEYNAGTEDLTSRVARLKVGLDNINIGVETKYQSAITSINNVSAGVNEAKALADSKAAAALAAAKTDATNKALADSKAAAALAAAKTDATNKANQALADAKADTTNRLKSYYSKSEIDVKENSINLSVTNARTYASQEAGKALDAAKTDATNKANNALTSAKNDTTEKLKSYYTKSQIDTSLENIRLSVETAAKTDATNKANNALTSAKNDTTEKLKSYYTKSQIDTSLENIRLSVETAKEYSDNKLKNYYSKSEIDVKTNSITQSVSEKVGNSEFSTKLRQSATDIQIAWNKINQYIDVKTNSITQSVSEKVGNSEFSTKLRQSATDIQIAWNKINQYIQFETLSGEARMSIYEPDGSSKNRLMSLGQKGMWFYRDNITIGKIGTNSLIDGSTWNGNREPRGLVFDVEAEGDYMAWATKYYSTDEHYRVRLLFTNANMYLGSRPREKGRFYFYSGIEMQNHIIWDADFRFSDLGSGYVPVQRRGDGNYVYIPTDKSFSNCLKCKVDNGILMIENK